MPRLQNYWYVCRLQIQRKLGSTLRSTHAWREGGRKQVGTRHGGGASCSNRCCSSRTRHLYGGNRQYRVKMTISDPSFSSLSNLPVPAVTVERTNWAMNKATLATISFPLCLLLRLLCGCGFGRALLGFILCVVNVCHSHPLSTPGTHDCFRPRPPPYTVYNATHWPYGRLWYSRWSCPNFSRFLSRHVCPVSSQS